MRIIRKPILSPNTCITRELYVTLITLIFLYAHFTILSLRIKYLKYLQSNLVASDTDTTVVLYCATFIDGKKHPSASES
jgi:hypothetical protein